MDTTSSLDFGVPRHDPRCASTSTALWFLVTVFTLVVLFSSVAMGYHGLPSRRETLLLNKHTTGTGPRVLRSSNPMAPFHQIPIPCACETNTLNQPAAQR